MLCMQHFENNIHIPLSHGDYKLESIQAAVTWPKTDSSYADCKVNLMMYFILYSSNVTLF